MLARGTPQKGPGTRGWVPQKGPGTRDLGTLLRTDIYASCIHAGGLSCLESIPTGYDCLYFLVFF